MGSRYHRRQCRWDRDFYVIAWRHDAQRLWRPYGQVSNERYQDKAASRPNGVWSFNMTSARLRGGDGSQDCEDTRAYH